MDFASNNIEGTFNEVCAQELPANDSVVDVTTSANVSVLLSDSLLRNKDYLMWTLNEKLYYNRLLPATVYIGMMSLLGSIGNAAVVCVYKTLRKKNTASAFIFSLGIVDLLICLFVMPYKLFDMRFPLLFGNSIVCKFYELFEIYLSMISIALMVCIAVDRFFIVTRPLKKMTLKTVYRIVFACTAFGLLLSWPTLFIYGESKVKTGIPGLIGSTCGVAEDMKVSLATRIWYYFLYLVFVVTLVFLIVIYSKIWINIRKWKDTVIGESVSNMPRWKKIDSDNNHNSIVPYGTNKNVSLCRYIPMRSFSTDPSSPDCDEDDIVLLEENSANSSATCSTLNTSRKDSLFMKGMCIFRLFPRNRRRHSTLSVTSTVTASTGKRVKMRRTTLVFGAISAIFVLSYLPCLLVILMRTLRIYKVTHAPAINAQIAEVFVRSGYLNSVLNPIIYSFMCSNFRNGVKDILFKPYK